MMAPRNPWADMARHPHAIARELARLGSVWNDTLARGWVPRNPCADARELARLERSLIRGDCIHPLLRAGDIVYVDREMLAQPGDVVSFRLSCRGAAAQNSGLPPGQSPWEPGARWCKLYDRVAGFDMLFDRHGNSATATLMTCESPDDDPLPNLHPVRQVLRAGELLFAPPAHAAQLGLNSAAAVYVTTNAGPVAIYTGTSGQTVLLGSVTVPAIPFATTVVITVTGVVAMNATGEQWPCCADVTTSPTSNITPSAANQILINPSSSQPQAASAFAIERTFSLAANTAQTYYLYGFTGTDGTPTFQTATVSSVNLKAEVIKR